jgi:periplasmic protein TonB
MKITFYLILFLLPFISLGQTNDSSVTIPTSERVYEWAELDKHPIFPGGDAALLKYISQNLKYPNFEQKDCILSKLYISFIINSNGMCCNPELVHCNCEPPSNYVEEIKSLFINMPQWIPGECNGISVPVKYIVPINIHVW